MVSHRFVEMTFAEMLIEYGVVNIHNLLHPKTIQNMNIKKVEYIVHNTYI